MIYRYRRDYYYVDAVGVQIKQITEQMKETDSKIAWFCKELWI